MSQEPQQPDLFDWKPEEESPWFVKTANYSIIGGLIVVLVFIWYIYFSTITPLFFAGLKSFYLGYPLLILGIMSLILSFLAVWLIPQSQVKSLNTKKGNETQSEFDLEKERIKLRDDTRKTMAQIIGGAFFIFGLIFTYNTLELNREGQVTERYAKAVELLGHKDLSVRLGGLYALERIAIDSPKDHSTIMEILSAYIREKSKEYREQNKNQPPSKKKINVNEIDNLADISAAAFIIDRRGIQNETEGQPFDWEGAIIRNLDLENMILRNSDFRNADLSYCDLVKADLYKGYFYKTDLSYTNLSKTDLRYSNMTSAILIEANLDEAKLNGVNFTDAILEKTSLANANFENAILINANLKYADLSYSSFTAANFNNANIEGAILYDADLSQISQNSLYASSLTFEQLSKAIIDKRTKLPKELEPHYPELLELSKKNLEERKKVLGEF